MLEVNTTVVACYLLFFVAEVTVVHVSGILAIVAIGFYMTYSGKTGISAESKHAVHHVWGYIGFLAETTIFVLSGIIIAIRVDNNDEIGAKDFGLLFLNYIILNFIRLGCLFLFWPILSRLGYGLTLKEIFLCSYAGLRGAVGLSLALIVANSKDVDNYVQDVIIFHVGGIATLTLLINATTVKYLVSYLGLA